MGSWADILEMIYNDGLELERTKEQAKKQKELEKITTDPREPSKPNPWEKENEEAGSK
jgi:hypothetical protein